jgi:hypothetical protein
MAATSDRVRKSPSALSGMETVAMLKPVETLVEAVVMAVPLVSHGAGAVPAPTYSKALHASRFGHDRRTSSVFFLDQRHRRASW